ncbi:hypothetical protein OSTOST_05426 [Ostertagia ostertagi]
MDLQKHMLCLFIALFYFLPELSFGRESGFDKARSLHKRDAEDKYYDPSTRMGCPPVRLLCQYTVKFLAKEAK